MSVKSNTPKFSCYKRYQKLKWLKYSSCFDTLSYLCPVIARCLAEMDLSLAADWIACAPSTKALVRESNSRSSPAAFPMTSAVTGGKQKDTYRKEYNDDINLFIPTPLLT